MEDKWAAAPRRKPTSYAADIAFLRTSVSFRIDPYARHGAKCPAAFYFSEKEDENLKWELHLRLNTAIFSG